MEIKSIVENLTYYNTATACHKFTNSLFAFGFFLVFFVQFDIFAQLHVVVGTAKFSVWVSRMNSTEKQHEVYWTTKESKREETPVAQVEMRKSNETKRKTLVGG